MMLCAFTHQYVHDIVLCRCLYEHIPQYLFWLLIFHNVSSGVIKQFMCGHINPRSWSFLTIARGWWGKFKVSCFSRFIVLSSLFNAVNSAAESRSVRIEFMLPYMNSVCLIIAFLMCVINHRLIFFTAKPT